jgi:hypothetical protein
MWDEVPDVCEGSRMAQQAINTQLKLVKNNYKNIWDGVPYVCKGSWMAQRAIG